MTGYSPSRPTPRLRVPTRSCAYTRRRRSFANGAVWLPAEASWLDDYVTELIGFPGSHYADQVDSTTQALDYMRKRFESGAFMNITEMFLKARRWRRKKW